MIGNFWYARSIAELSDYLEAGRSGEDLGRAEWVEPLNMNARTLEDATDLMTLLATRSTKQRNVGGHLEVSFAHEDVTDRALMMRVADRVLRALRLSEHFAVVVCHGDKERGIL